METLENKKIKLFEEIYRTCNEESLQEALATYVGPGDFNGFIQTCNKCGKKYLGSWNWFCKKCWPIVNAEKEEAERKEREAMK